MKHFLSGLFLLAVALTGSWLPAQSATSIAQGWSWNTATSPPTLCLNPLGSSSICGPIGTMTAGGQYLLPTTMGGTGLIAGTSGGIPYFSSATTMASSGLLALNALMIGGGAGASPSTLASNGTTTQVLHGGAVPSWGSVNLSTDANGTLQVGQMPVFTGDVTNTGLGTTVAAIQGTIVTGTTGTGAAVLGTTPTITRPTLNGFTDGSVAAAGVVGEPLSSSIPVGSAVSLVSATTKDITTLPLTAGQWSCHGSFVTNPAAGTTTSAISAGISLVANTPPALHAGGGFSALPYSAPANAIVAIPFGPQLFIINAGTTLHLVANVTFAVSTMSGYGFLECVRMR